MSTILYQETPRGPSILIEVAIPAGSLRVPIGDIQQLRSQEGQTVIIKGLRLVPPKVLTNGVQIQNANVPLAELRKMALTIYAEGWEKGRNIPLLLLNDFADSDATNATTVPFRNKPTKFDNWRNVDWAQSYVQLVAALTGGPYTLLLDCEYEKLNAKGVPIIGPS